MLILTVANAANKLKVAHGQLVDNYNCSMFRGSGHIALVHHRAETTPLTVKVADPRFRLT